MVLAGAGWWLRMAVSRTDLPAAGTLRGANILLITIDTLRADHLGVYGGAAPTPTLDALARGGLRFAHAYAHAPMTLPSHASLLTGLLPLHHGVRNNGTFRLAPGTPTLATALTGAGYRSAAFIGAFVLDRRFGLDAGFEAYDDRIASTSGPLDFHLPERRADAVLAPAAQWIDGQAADRPWFAWVHLFDPHAPYAAPIVTTGRPYDDEIAYVDRQLGGFLDRLRRDGRLAHTVVVVTADHGEALGDHGETTHGLFAYDATVRVPLIVSGAGVPSAVIEPPVAHVDLVPTLLEWTGVAAPSTDGQPLRTLLDGSARSRPIYIEALDASLNRDWAPLHAVVLGRWKYVDLPVPELYDLDADPGETQNRAGQDGPRAETLRLRLDALRRNAVGGTAATLDAEARARLGALGYTAGAPARPARTYTEADDPKRLLARHREYLGALGRAEHGDAAGALAALERLVAEQPTFTAAYTSAATLLIDAGQPARAVDLLRGAQARGVDTAGLAERLGAALLAAGDAPAAVTTLRPLAAADAPDAEALNTLSVALARLHRVDEARAMMRRALALSPSAAPVWMNLGLLELEAGDSAGAAAAFERVITLDARAADAWRGLGAARAASDPRGAIDAWRRVLDLAPDDRDALFNVCVVLADLDPAAARPFMERYLALEGTSAADRAHVRRLLAESGKQTPE